MKSNEIEKRIKELETEFSKKGLKPNQIKSLIELEITEIKEKEIESINSEKSELLKRLSEIKETEKSLGIKKSRGLSGGNKTSNINYFEILETKEEIIPNSILHIFHEPSERFIPRGISIKSIE
jgi:hypothetical protein